MTAPLSRPIERIAQWAALDGAGSQLAAVTSDRRGRLVEWARGRPLGHPAHPALTDLPIGFWTSAWVLDLVDRGGHSRSARALVGWGVVSAVPTIVTGLADVPALSARRRRVVVVHAAANAMATAGFATSWCLRRAGHGRAGVLTSLAAGSVASLGGYLGGWLALGDDDQHDDARAAGDDGAVLADRATARLGERRLAAAESCTAGRIASALAASGDAANFFRGSIVSYQDDVKRAQLGVRAESVYSLAAATEMARGVCKLLAADAAIATSGVLGDKPQDGVAPGTVFIATAVDGHADAREYRFEGSPADVCDQARDQALRDLERALDRANSRATSAHA